MHVLASTVPSVQEKDDSFHCTKWIKTEDNNFQTIPAYQDRDALIAVELSARMAQDCWVLTAKQCQGISYHSTTKSVPT